MNRPAQLVCTFLLSAVLFAPWPALAGIFDSPENLEVLPEEITPQALRATMRSFAMGLGARCETCHVGESGAPLDTFDFASDKKQEKLTARTMMKMVAGINADLQASLDRDAAERVEVRCVTCHRGQQRPRMLAAVLDEALTANGLQAGVERYRELREKYYGSHTFDFSEGVLVAFAEQLARRDDGPSALAFLNLNLEHFPQSVWTYATRGEIEARSGDTEAAIATLEKALAINPDAQFVKKRLEQLRTP